MTPSKSDAWDLYWENDHRTARQPGDERLYQGVIRERWNEVFSILQGSCRLLDLACGDGALARLAAQSGRAMEMHCVDAAAFRPLLNEAGESMLKVRYYPQTFNEHLPFAADMFDGCISQFGFEYGDPDQSAAEIARILKPQGWIHWICHWRSGSVARNAEDEATRAKALRALDLPALTARLVELQVHDGKYISDSHQRTWHLPEAQQLKRGLSEGFRITRSRPGAPNGNLGLFLHNLAHLYQHREQHPVGDALALLKQCDEQLSRHQKRLEALVSSALTPERLQRLQALFRESSLEPFEQKLLHEPASGEVVAVELSSLSLPGQ